MSVNEDTIFVNGSVDAIIVGEGTLSVQSIEKGDEILIAPNPFTNKLQIGTETNISWKLYNTIGVQVLKGTSNILKGDFLRPGMYFLAIDNKKVIKVLKK